MVDCLDEAREKVRRATVHADDLAARITEWTSHKNNTELEIGKHYNSQENYFSFVLEKAVQPPPQEWCLIIGDAVHNTRSALDYLAWQLVHVGSALRPLKRPNAVQFPIITQPPKPGVTSMKALKVQAQSRLPGVDDLHLTVVLRYQPFVARPGNPDLHPFAMLNMLSNHDKHRSLRLVRNLIHDVSAELIDATNFDNTKARSGKIRELNPGAELFRVYGTPTGKGQPDVTVKFKGGGLIVYADDPDLPRLLVSITYPYAASIALVTDLLNEFDRIL